MAKYYCGHLNLDIIKKRNHKNKYEVHIESIKGKEIIDVISADIHRDIHQIIQTAVEEYPYRHYRKYAARIGLFKFHVTRDPNNRWPKKKRSKKQIKNQLTV